MDDLTGMQLGRYTLVEELGQGAETSRDPHLEGAEITRLFKAYDKRLDRHVALKLVTRSQEYSQDFAGYFLKEARALAQLSHASIIKVLDFGQEAGYLFLVTELINGHPLSAYIGKPMDWRDAVTLLMPAADALEYAHQRSIFHRDLKPGNILLNDENQPVIQDFGIARMIEQEETREMTGTNVGLGSPYYMSPEQAKGLPVDYRADIYAFGIILFELLTGRRPFEAESGMEVIIQQVSSEPPSPRTFVPGLPEPLETIILTALKKDPDERFQSMAEMSTALKQLLESGKYAARKRRQPWSRRRWIATVSAGLVLALLAGGGLLASGMIPGMQSARQTPTGVPTAISAVEGKISPTPTAGTKRETPQATRTPAPTPTTQPPAPEPSQAAPVFQLPTYPLIQKQPLPELAGPITVENLAQLSEVARYGYPRIQAMVWSADNQMLIGATSAGVFFYNPANIQPEAFFGAQGWLTAIDLSKDGQWIATGDQNGSVHIWDARTGKEKLALAGHTGQITRVKFSPDGTRLVSASVDKTARIWDTTSGEALFILAKHGLEVNAVVFAPDGKTVITGSNDFQTILWDVATGKSVGSFRSQSMIYDLAITSDGKTLAAALRNATVDIWNLETKKQVRIIWDRVQVEPVYEIEFSSNGQLLATASGDSLLRVWNINNGSLLWSKSAAKNASITENVGSSTPVDKTLDQIGSLAFSSDARLVTVTQGNTVTTWDLSGQKALSKANLAWTRIDRLGLSPDGKMLVLQAGSQRVLTWEMERGNLLSEYSGTIPRGSIFSQGSQLMTLQVGDNIDLYSASTSVTVKRKTLSMPPASISTGFILDDRIVAAAAAQSLTLWATNSGYELNSENSKAMANCRVAYAEDGSFLAAGSSVGVFTNEAAAPFLCRINRSIRVKDETYNPDGKYLAFALDNGQVELWANTENARAEYFKAADGKVLGIALSPDNGLLATGGEDGKVKIWNPATKELLATLDHHTGPVYDLIFSADGTMLITCSEDGTFEVWGLIQPNSGG